MTHYSAQELLSRGFLPAELPPIFTSLSLGNAYPSLSGHLERCMPGKGIRVLPTSFHLARQGTLRRRLSIPHPLYYAQLCQCIEQHSHELSAALDRSTWSRSKPAPNSSGKERALERPLKDSLIVEAHASVRATSRYLVQADIAQFYHSIYTHIFGWSLGGKPEAKALAKGVSPHVGNHAAQGAAIGNLLDKKVRQLQDGQSVGLPMGPDASLLLAEVLLCGVDQKLATALEQEGIKVVAMRNVDDYHFGVQSHDDAERVLTLLQNHLRTELELALNPRKTKIVALPAPLEDPWVTQLKGIFSQAAVPPRQKRRDLLRLFDLATTARSQYPEEHVFSYLLGILRNVNIESENWTLLQPLLLQIALAESGALRQMLLDLLWYQSQGCSLDFVRWKDVWERLIVSHAPQEHSSEVVWALWGLYELEQKLSSEVVTALLDMADPIVSLLALYMVEQGRCEVEADKDRLKTKYQERVSVENFWGEQWPLIYEATKRGWLTTPEPLKNERGYKLLFDQGVTFLDVTKRLDPHALDSQKSYGSQ